MERTSSGLRLLMKILWKALYAMLIVLVAIMTVVMFLQIVMRAFELQPFKWSEEMLRYMYVWVVFLGLPVAIYSNDLTRFDLLKKKFSANANIILETVLIGAMLVILFFMVKGSFTVIHIQMRQMMTSTKIPMGIIYLVMPISGICSILFLIAKLFLLWTKQPDFNIGDVKVEITEESVVP